MLVFGSSHQTSIGYEVVPANLQFFGLVLGGVRSRITVVTTFHEKEIYLNALVTGRWLFAANLSSLFLGWMSGDG